MQVPDESDDRADEHLDAADDEQPGAGGHQSVGEEHEAADEEPHADEHIIGDADDLVALADDKLFGPDMQVNVAVVLSYATLLFRRRDSALLGSSVPHSWDLGGALLLSLQCEPTGRPACRAGPRFAESHVSVES